MRTSMLSVFAAAAVLAACSDATAPDTSSPISGLNPSFSRGSDNGDDRDDDSDDRGAGGVFTQTNDPAGNAIVAYTRRADGSLVYLGTYPTGGRGSANGLGSQGAVLLTPNNRFLLAVNAGSNQISSFAVGKARLTLVATVASSEASDGQRPISVAATNRVAYALNNGSNTVTGFRIGHNGALTPVRRWTRSLSQSGANAAQVQFSRDGRFLVVVHRTAAGEHRAPGFDVFPVRDDGSLGKPVFSPSVGTAPFGFDITARGQIIVSEPGPNPGGVPQAMTPYRIARHGSLSVVPPGAVETTEAAPCWVVITHDGRFAYSANAGSASISGFAVAANGSLRLITPDGRTGVTDSGPLDMDISRDGRFLYAVEGGGNSTGNVTGFAIGRDGSLTRLEGATRPESARGRGGLAAF